MNNIPENQRFCLGIVGGMGPASGVRFQELVIRETPASCDQDHIPVICYTNPAIPDRTESLRQNGGMAFVAAATESIRALERAGATHLAVTCNTAHARFRELQRATHLPMLNMVNLVAERIAELQPRPNTVGILATDGTIRTKLYTQALAPYGIQTLTPASKDQILIMQTISRIKAGKFTRRDLAKLTAVRDRLQARHTEAIVLACTELSLYCRELSFPDIPILDPMRILARHAVGLSQEIRERCIPDHCTLTKHTDFARVHASNT
jgi:aspartate racemase